MTDLDAKKILDAWIRYYIDENGTQVTYLDENDPDAIVAKLKGFRMGITGHYKTMLIQKETE